MRPLAIVTLVAALSAATPAAACHHYSIWKYPYPQHCGAGGPRVRVAVARVPAREEMPLPSPRPAEPPERLGVPTATPRMVAPTISPPPEEWEDDMVRAIALQKLREKLK